MILRLFAFRLKEGLDGRFQAAVRAEGLSGFLRRTGATSASIGVASSDRGTEYVAFSMWAEPEAIVGSVGFEQSRPLHVPAMARYVVAGPPEHFEAMSLPPVRKAGEASTMRIFRARIEPPGDAVLFDYVRTTSWPVLIAHEGALDGWIGRQSRVGGGALLSVTLWRNYEDIEQVGNGEVVGPLTARP